MQISQLRLSFSPPGKVHGSLARAGKVRGQTPKVTISLFTLPPLQFPEHTYVVYEMTFYIFLIRGFKSIHYDHREITRPLSVMSSRLKSRRRRRRGLAAPSAASSTTGAS